MSGIREDRPEPIDVAAWRKAMEGATANSWFVSGVRFRMGGCEWQGVNSYNEADKRDDGVACISIDPRTGAGLRDAAWIARCSPMEISKLLDEIERLREAARPLARLKIPWKPQGNAGAYSIRHDDILRAQSVLENGPASLADATSKSHPAPAEKPAKQEDGDV